MHTPSPPAAGSLRGPVLWGVVWGVIQAAAPLGFWWLDPATVYGLSVALIAAIYLGFAVADGRPRVIAVEAGVAAAFVVVGAAGGTRAAGPPGGRPGWPWVQGPVAAPDPLRRQPSLVPAVLPGRRLGRRRHPGRA